jgi:hypothetical protein
MGVATRHCTGRLRILIAFMNWTIALIARTDSFLAGANTSQCTDAVRLCWRPGLM